MKILIEILTAIKATNEKLDALIELTERNKTEDKFKEYKTDKGLYTRRTK